MNKFVGFLAVGAIVFLLALAVGSGSVVSAAGTVPNDIPATAALIDGQPHQISGNASLWYKFDYSVSHSEGKTQGEPVTLIMDNGTQSGVNFGIYTPDKILTWWENDPVGRGTPQLLTDSNQPVLYNGDHFSSDLSWVGRFAATGTYYVKVTNDNAYPVTFTMYIEDSTLQ